MNSSNNALQQYLELHDAHREAIDAHSAAPMRALRSRARLRLEPPARLPRKADEGYARTDIDAIFAPDFGINIMRVPAPVDIAASLRCDIPNISTLMAVVAGDEFRPTDTLVRNMPAGVTLTSFSEAEKTMPGLVAGYLGRLADADEGADTATLLNSLLAQDGVLLHVSAGTVCTKPLQLVNIFNAGIPTLAARRVLIVLEPGASASLLVCDHTQSRGIACLASEVTEIFLGNGARLDYCHLEESNPDTSRVASLHASVGADATLDINGSTLSGGRTRNSYTVHLDHPGAQARIAGMAIASGTQHTDNNTFIHHHAPHCTSSQLFKYILDGSASGAFRGLIRVDQDAAFTEAYQTNRNLLASEQATMHTEPQLEIYCDEVKCGHGATTGQLDQAAMFYMRSRGIPQAQARMMLMQAFMADVVDTIAIPSLRDRLRMLVERRLNGQQTACGDCAAACAPAPSTQP